MSTMTELSQTKASGLKHSISDWRELVIQANSVLRWDQDWYPFAIIGVVSTFFMSVWYWDPTLITFVAFSGLFLTIADYVGPKVINQVYGVDSWSSSKEMQFDQVCENMVLGLEKVENLWAVCREARSRKPILHFVATLLFFFSLASLGNRINNFFLTYLLTNAILMLPGLHHKGILHQYGAQITIKIAELMKGKDYMKKAE